MMHKSVIDLDYSGTSPQRTFGVDVTRWVGTGAAESICKHFSKALLEYPSPWIWYVVAGRIMLNIEQPIKPNSNLTHSH